MPITSFRRLAASSLTLALGLTVAATAPAMAGHKPAKSLTAKTGAPSKPAKARGVLAATGSVTRDAAAETGAPEAPGVTWTSAEPDELRCGRSRRKLWQPGEGWMVKTVTVCR